MEAARSRAPGPGSSALCLLLALITFTCSRRKSTCERSVARRLGTRGGAAELKAHPFFDGLDWDRLAAATAPNIPSLTGELDTSNFEDFEEEAGPAGGGRRRTKRADPEFMCFTYKNMQARRSPDTRNYPSAFRVSRSAERARCAVLLDCASGTHTTNVLHSLVSCHRHDN